MPDWFVKLMQRLPQSTDEWACRWFQTIATLSVGALILTAVELPADGAAWGMASSAGILGLVVGTRRSEGATC